MNNRRAVLAGLGGLGLAGLGLAGLGGCATSGAPAQTAPVRPGLAALPRLAPVRAGMDRVTRITVCLRPFRAAGPRLDVEMVGDKRVVHNYGHGGAGWSLSWGSSAIAVEKAMTGGAREAAVIGCGALGLTSALLLQRAGAKVIIYAAERAPMTRSARATGTWSPDSRIADSARVAADFPAIWERMARTSYAEYQTWLGLPGAPVSWSDRYSLFDDATPPPAPSPGPTNAIRFFGAPLPGLAPRWRDISPQEHPFPVSRVRHGVAMQFNVAELSHLLMTDFLLAGGRMETRTFNSPGELTTLPQPVIVNCTGYGARALWKDETMTPVRGQITWLAPQPELTYGLYWRHISVLPRADGIVVQDGGDSEMFGYGIEDETPDRGEAERAVKTIADLYASMGAGPPR
jgi:glycine/D-amino acid oxidase-like deaminating enzyme